MILRITIIGLLAGVIGTGLGGIISALFKRNVDKYLDFFMGLSGGVMLAVVVFDLMKESMNEMGVLPTVIFIFIGVLLTMFLKTKLDMSKEMKAGYLIFISILLHQKHSTCIFLKVWAQMMQFTLIFCLHTEGTVFTWR